MSVDWEPKEEHQAIIARSIEFISDELAELQEALDCQNSLIVEISNQVISQYKTNQIIIRRDEEWMDFLHAHDLNQLDLWSPLIGGILLYLGLRIKITEVDPDK